MRKLSFLMRHAVPLSPDANRSAFRWSQVGQKVATLLMVGATQFIKKVHYRFRLFRFSSIYRIDCLYYIFETIVSEPHHHRKPFSLAKNIII